MWAVVIVWLVCIAICRIIGTRKGMYGAGIVTGLILGPVGIVIMVLMPDRSRPL